MWRLQIALFVRLTVDDTKTLSWSFTIINDKEKQQTL